MAELKSLAKDTAIYGASSIIGKFLNYLLVPVYTISLPASSGGYGVITNMYAIVALLLYRHPFRTVSCKPLYFAANVFPFCK